MSIDFWTIGLEAVNFLVLVWLLERLLYRPVLGVIGRRQAEIDRLHQVDEAAHQALAAQRTQLEQERAAFSMDRARALEDAHATALEERKRLETETRAEVDHLLAAGRARIDHERSEAVQALRRKSVELGTAIARRLLTLSTPSGGDGRFVEAVCGQLRDMDGHDRARLVSNLGEGAVVRVVTAETLGPKGESECRARLAELLAGGFDTRFSVDPSLIAGIEIYFPSFVLRHSWRDALAANEAALMKEAELGSLVTDNHATNPD